MNEVGELRASQLIYTFGVGSVFDLPRFSALVLGLDDWDANACPEIQEDRLLAALQKRLGSQLASLRLPPVSREGAATPPAGTLAGVPVAAFPRWMRCPNCHLLASVDTGMFTLSQVPDRPDAARYLHKTCQKAREPVAIPVRFMLACREGHLTDFPWIAFVHHKGPVCAAPQLFLHEFGATGDPSDVKVECGTCRAHRRMSEAFDVDRFQVACPGHHPHLRRVDRTPCREKPRTMLLGASNSWFPITLSALYLPRRQDALALAVTREWAHLKDLPSFDVCAFVTAPVRMPIFAGFSPQDVWAAVQARRNEGPSNTVPEDLRIAEWAVLSTGQSATVDTDFTLRMVAPPAGFVGFLEDTVLVERLREVRALIGFTRVESNGDFLDVDANEVQRLTPLARDALRWVPAAEVRGEGMFLRVREEALQAWESRAEVRALQPAFERAHQAWRQKRSLNPANAGFPGMRYLLLHSFSHALMRQIALECGYGSTSLRERLYCRMPGEEHGPMAGVLIYTSASDSEGTLGGLVALGEPAILGSHVRHALLAMDVCASDPLCADHAPEEEGRGVHASACHACLFASETSCERGNRYLDRNLLVHTFAGRGVSFFPDPGAG